MSAFDSIMADNTDTDFVVGYSFSSLGHNLIGNFGNYPGGLVDSDMLGLDPLLAPLGNYGGPTPTMPPLPGSPAIDAGDNTNAPATDQQGLPRVVNGTIDIGAVECQGFTTAIARGNNQTTKANSPFAAPLVVTVTSPFDEPVQGGMVTFTAPSNVTFPGTTGTILTVAGDGTQGYGGDNGPATAAALNAPTGVATDAAGDLFVADSDGNRIREVLHATGTIVTVAGDGVRGYSGDNGPATSAELAYPDGLAVDAAGDVFIADSFNHRVREVVHATGTILTVAGNGLQGYSGDGGPATRAALSYLWCGGGRGR
jgi:hypothetical protein